ncbi:MAG: glycosyltransferase family 39 protein [bacterium]|nr:glycosyltransferase family 39 protein [bacterium]
MINRRYILVAALLFGFTAAAFLYFSVWNPEFWFDEGIFVQLVRNIAEQGVWGIEIAPGTFYNAALITMGYPTIYPAVAAILIFGFSVTVFHIVAVLFALGLVVAFFFLSRKLYGNRIACVGTALLTTFTPLYGNGKSFAGETPALFFLVAGLLLLLYAEQSAKASSVLFAASGVVLGFAASAKPTFLVILPALFLALLFNARRMVLTPEGRRQTLWLALGCVGAILWWIFTQFGGASSLARIFGHYANPYYVADFVPLIAANIARFFTESTPAHLLVLFLVAFAFLVKKIWQQRGVSMAEIAAFLFALLTLAFYVRTEGWYRYFYPAHIMLFLFLAPGIDAMLGVALKRDGLRLKFFAALIAVFIGAQLVPLWKEGSRVRDVLPVTIGSHLEALRSDNNVFFYNLPQIAARHQSSAFYQYIRMSDRFIVGQENEAKLLRGVFSTIFVPRNSGPEIERIPPCYAFQGDVGKIFMYRRDSARACSDES